MRSTLRRYPAARRPAATVTLVALPTRVVGSWLRVALAQVNATVGDLAGNAELVLDVDPPRRTPQAPTWWPSPRCSSPATRSRTSPSASRSSRPRRPTLARSPDRCGGRTRRASTVVVGYLDQRADQRGSAGPPPALAAERGGGDSRRAGGRALRQAPLAELRSLRRVPLLRTGRTSRASSTWTAPTSRSSICEDLWQDGGPIGGPRGQAPTCRGDQWLTVRAQQGRRPP